MAFSYPCNFSYLPPGGGGGSTIRAGGVGSSPGGGPWALSHFNWASLKSGGVAIRIVVDRVDHKKQEAVLLHRTLEACGYF